VIRTPEVGDVPAFDLIVPATGCEQVRAAAHDAGAPAGDPAAWDLARLRAGRPAWGVDMDDTTLAQEAEMDRWQAISYEKGCYTGQETVARVHFRGHVNRTLRRVSTHPGLVPHGAELLDGSGAVMGTMRSGRTAPDGSHLGLALVRREITAPAHLSTADGAVVAVSPWPDATA
jgi:tRNA-modifying protein YgfZ